MRDKKDKNSKLNVFYLGLVSFLNDLSSEMIMPILPMFISVLGGSGMVVGLIGGLRDSVASILKVFAGFWSDKTGKRKIFVFSGYLTSAVFKFLLSFSRSWQHILVFTGFERIGKGLRTAPRDALISESMPKEKGKGFGIHRAMDTFGAILGSLLTLFLFWLWHFDFKSIIFVASILALFSLVPLFFVKERKKEIQNINLNIGLKHLSMPLRTFIIIASIFALANFTYMFFILKAQRVFEGRFSIGVPILLYTIFNAFYAFFSIPFGILSDKIGKGRVLLAGYFLYSLICLGFVFSHSFVGFAFLFAVYGLVYAMVDGNQRAFVSDLSSKDLRGTALGTFHTIAGLATLPTGLIAGILWKIAPSLTFMYGAGLGFISVVSMLIFLNRYEKDKLIMV